MSTKGNLNRNKTDKLRENHLRQSERQFQHKRSLNIERQNIVY